MDTRSVDKVEKTRMISQLSLKGGVEISSSIAANVKLVSLVIS